MRLYYAIIPLTALALSIATAIPGLASEYLYVTINQHEALGAENYSFRAAVNNSNANTCKLETPLGIYHAVSNGDYFPFEAGEFLSDHSNLDFVEMSSVIEPGWILTWNEGLETQTVAELSFNRVEEGVFPMPPIIIRPSDGAGDIPPDTPVEWFFGGEDPCAVSGKAIICTTSPTNSLVCTNTDTCTVDSWQPDAPFNSGTWSVEVINASWLQDNHEGLIINGYPWELDSHRWLNVRGVDSHLFAVVPTRNYSFSIVKSLYRP